MPRPRRQVPFRAFVLGLALACPLVGQAAVSDIRVSVVSGALRIGGGPGDETFILRSGLDPGSFEVAPFDAGNTINGAPGAATFTGVDGAVVIDTGDGSDWVAIENAVLPGDLTIHGGRGDDEIEIFQSEVGGRTRIYGGRDPDFVDLFESRFVDDVRVDTAAEADSFLATFSEFEGRLVVNLGTGEDEAEFFQSATQAARVRTGRGDDGTIVGESTFHGNVAFNGGPGFDFAEFYGPNVFEGRRAMSGYEDEVELP